MFDTMTKKTNTKKIGSCLFGSSVYYNNYYSAICTVRQVRRVVFTYQRTNKSNAHNYNIITL